MRQMQKVLWTKGVLLTPQHLQVQDRFVESLVDFENSALAFCPWGFGQLQIDHEALAGGVLSVTEASGIFPDGLPFEFPQADAPPLPKELASHWQPDQGSLNVYLTIPEYRPGGNNLSTGAQERNTRYIAEVTVRRDENTGTDERPIQIARKNFRLLVEGESLEGNSVLHVARVVRTSTGTFQLDPKFVPPLIDISASDFLMAIARRLLEILSAKSSSLAGTRRQRNQGLADFGVSDVASFWLLYNVNNFLPQVRHLFETRRGHPEQLFSIMLGLAGALSTFSPTIHPRNLPPYDHADLAGCFGSLDTLIRELLETVVPTSHVSLPLRLIEPTRYATAIDQDRYLTAPQWYLGVNAEMPVGDLIREVPRRIKMSSADQIDRLIKLALAGIPLRHVPSPPGGIPIKMNYQYFVLDRSVPDWEAVKRDRNLAVYVPLELPETHLELIILLPQDR